MSEEHHVQLIDDKRSVDEQLEASQQYIKELHLQYGLNTIFIAGFVAIVVQTFSYLFFSAPLTELGIMLYMFSLLIGPSALFLLLLHFYELYGMVRTGEKSIPLTLDLMYFLYIGLAFATMGGVQWYYLRHSISSAFLTTGWSLAVSVLILEVLIALLLAKFIITKKLSPRLPHLFKQPDSKQHKTLHLHSLHRSLTLPHQVYYFRKKPDVTRWEHDDCFVSLKR
jgi:hypothetical protein